MDDGANEAWKVEGQAGLVEQLGQLTPKPRASLPTALTDRLRSWASLNPSAAEPVQTVIGARVRNHRRHQSARPLTRAVASGTIQHLPTQMKPPFQHPDFEVHAFENVPLDRDVFLMDEKWLRPYERAAIKMFDGGKYANVGYVSYAAIHVVDAGSLELSWYPNLHDRFHRVSVRLPRSAFLTCVSTPRWDDKPRVFVLGAWLTNLHLRPFSAFAIVDAIGVKNALAAGTLQGPALIRLRRRIDRIAATNPQIAFLSFADSILLKMNWFVGQWDSEVKYTYEPETLIRIMPSIAQAFQEVVGLNVYSIITQGFNEYEDPKLLHRSSKGNHLSLNSLGLPFAHLFAIDDAARSAIREKTHAPAELYLDENFYYSLRLRLDFEKHDLPHAEYKPPMTSVPGNYFFAGRQTILENLRTDPPERRRNSRKR
jgi:hypothetical protein